MSLTYRQREVEALVAQRLSDQEIAERLNCSKHTVHAHVAAIARCIRDVHPEAPPYLKGRKLVRWLHRMFDVPRGTTV